MKDVGDTSMNGKDIFRLLLQTKQAEVVEDNIVAPQDVSVPPKSQRVDAPVTGSTIVVHVQPDLASVVPLPYNLPPSPALALEPPKEVASHSELPKVGTGGTTTESSNTSVSASNDVAAAMPVADENGKLNRSKAKKPSANIDGEMEPGSVPVTTKRGVPKRGDNSKGSLMKNCAGINETGRSDLGEYLPRPASLLNLVAIRRTAERCVTEPGYEANKLFHNMAMKVSLRYSFTWTALTNPD